MGDPRREVPYPRTPRNRLCRAASVAPWGGAKRCGGSPYAYFSRIRVERSTSRKVSTSEFEVDTASMTEQAIMR